MIRAKRKPLQAAVRSKATACLAPRAPCTLGAVPKRSSGLEVAIRIKSRSSGFHPACSRAASAARVAITVRGSSALQIRRAPMPVRVRIHSSLVSTRVLSCSLLTRLTGTALPHPTRAMPKGALAALVIWPGPRRWGSVNHRRRSRFRLRSDGAGPPSRRGSRRNGRCAER